MKVGYILPTWPNDTDHGSAPWFGIRDLALRAEAVRFDSVWVVDNFLYPTEAGGQLGFRECWSVLSAVGTTTSRVAIGSLVTNLNARNPAVVAKIADTVDEISEGRLILGVGAGEPEGQFSAFGFPWEKRTSRFEEAIEIIRPLLRKGEVDYQGDYHTVRHCRLLPRGPRLEGPPIMIGAFGPRMMRIAAEHADMWSYWLAFDENTVETLKLPLEQLERACAEAGRDPESLEKTVALGVRLGDAPLKWGADDVGAGAITGDIEAITEALFSFAEVGISHVQIYLAPSTQEGLESFAPVLEALGKS